MRMKNLANKVWLQKNPNIIEEIVAKEILPKRKRIGNKQSKKGVKCPDCP